MAQARNIVHVPQPVGVDVPKQVPAIFEPKHMGKSGKDLTVDRHNASRVY